MTTGGSPLIYGDGLVPDTGNYAQWWGIYFNMLFKNSIQSSVYSSPYKQYYHYADNKGDLGMGITGELVVGCYHTNVSTSLNNPRRGLFSIAIFDPNYINFWVRSRYIIRKSTKSFLSLW